MNPTALDSDPVLLAHDLGPVLGRLVRRLRRERRLPLTHGAVLAALEREPGRSVADLAKAERVRPQSMAQTVGELEADGLLTRAPDPGDGRRALITLTDGGIELLATERGRREGWLGAAIADALSPTERAALARAIPLLARIADRER